MKWGYNYMLREPGKISNNVHFIFLNKLSIITVGKLNNFGNSVPKIIVEEPAHGPVPMVCCAHIDQSNKRIIKPFTIGPNRVLMGCKSNSITIQSIRGNSVTSQLVMQHHVQA
jgi:hypothetical protein